MATRTVMMVTLRAGLSCSHSVVPIGLQTNIPCILSLSPPHPASVSHTHPCPGSAHPHLTASLWEESRHPHLAASLYFSHLIPAFKKLLCLGLWLSLSWLLPPPSGSFSLCLLSIKNLG